MDDGNLGVGNFYGKLWISSFVHRYDCMSFFVGFWLILGLLVKTGYGNYTMDESWGLFLFAVLSCVHNEDVWRNSSILIS